MKKYNKLPEGWVVKENGNAPVGYKLISNNKSIFSNEYQNGLLKEKEENNMKTINQLFNETKIDCFDFNDKTFGVIVTIVQIREDEKNDDDHYKFVYELCNKVIVSNNRGNFAEADFAGFIKSNIEKFRQFANKHWFVELPENEEELIYAWVDKLHRYSAGYLKEELYSELYEIVKGGVING